MTSGQISPRPSDDDREPETTPGSAPKSSGKSGKRLVAEPSNPMANARIFLGAQYVDGDHGLLVYHRGEFRRWNGSFWPILDDDVLRAKVARFFERAVYMRQTSNGLVEEQFKPSKGKATEIVEALKAITIEADREIPSWLDQTKPISPQEILPMANGLLRIPHRILLPPTPEFFNSYALPYQYDPEAPRPERWLRFLDEVWDDDDESKATLQEWAGYQLTPDTSQQKILWVPGPKRAGKGTIGRVLRRLVGAENTVGLILKALGTNFGLQPLIDCPVAMISDARMSDAQDGSVVVERLLTISGEDQLTIDRKYKNAWTGTLPTRLTIMSNETPQLTDVSGALASRLLILRMVNSFYGREDTGLFNELIGEIPGILRWALDGRDRLHERGHFIQPASGQILVDEIEAFSSPISTFIKECCVVGPERSVAKAELFTAWVRWSRESNLNPGSKKKFGADLRAALPRIEDRRGSGEPRQREYVGIGLAT